MLISKSCGALCYSTGRGVKVNISRKEHYRDYESSYYNVPKAGESWVTNLIAFANRKNFTFSDIKHWMKMKAYQKVIEDQKLVFIFILHEIVISNY